MAFLCRLEKMKQELVLRVQQQTQGERVHASLWEQLALTTAGFRSTASAVRDTDREYLTLVKQLNKNIQTDQRKQIAVRHPQCDSPVIFMGVCPLASSTPCTLPHLLPAKFHSLIHVERLQFLKCALFPAPTMSRSV